MTSCITSLDQVSDEQIDLAVQAMGGDPHLGIMALADVTNTMVVLEDVAHARESFLTRYRRIQEAKNIE